MRAHVSTRGFTLVELLMVISIMVIMAAFILAGAKALGIGSKKAKSQTILAAIRKGIELTNANKGGSVSPTEHPLTGSVAPRFKFLRSIVPTGRTQPSQPSPNQLALAGVESGNIMSAHVTRLLLPSDVYADPVSPMLFGFTRENIGVIGAQQRRVTKCLLLPKPGPDPVIPLPDSDVQWLKVSSTEPGGNTASPYTLVWYPNNQIPPADIYLKDPEFGKPAANKQAINYLFGSSSVEGELAGLGALFTADPALPDTTSKFRHPLNSAGGDWGSETFPLVYTNSNGSDSNSEAYWKPGCISINGTVISSTAGAKWVRYRLPGLALYDAWGQDILCAVTRNGDLRLWSPGADGVYVVEPGKNHRLDTVDPVPQPPNGLVSRVGDDQDGTSDNIFEGVK